MLWVFLMFGEPVALVGLLGLAVSAAGVLFVLRRRRAVTPTRQLTRSARATEAMALTRAPVTRQVPPPL